MYHNECLELDKEKDLFGTDPILHNESLPTLYCLTDNHNQNNNCTQTRFRVPVVQPLQGGRTQLNKICKGCDNFPTATN